MISFKVKTVVHCCQYFWLWTKICQTLGLGPYVFHTNGLYWLLGRVTSILNCDWSVGCHLSTILISHWSRSRSCTNLSEGSSLIIKQTCFLYLLYRKRQINQIDSTKRVPIITLKLKSDVLSMSVFLYVIFCILNSLLISPNLCHV